jgi:general secretion pathway protein A
MYERFFGLADVPFRLTPDPRYLFLSPKHAEALAHLKLGLRESSGFVCITGDVGTGKTTLLRAFLTSVGPEVASAYIFNPPLSAVELLKTINSELGLRADTGSRKKLVDALNVHLLEQREAGRRSIVVIDEAQALPIDVLEQLRLLSNLETTTEKLLRIVLVGQPQLRALLLHPDLLQLNQRITLRWHLGPLSYPETADYIRHRLAVAGAGLTPPVFTRAAIRTVHRHSGGVPRLINMMAHRAMLAAFAADRRVVKSRSVRQACREIGALPLAAPGGRPVRRAAWVLAGMGVSLVVVALGAARLGWRPPYRLALPALSALPAHVGAPEAPPAAEPNPAEGPAMLAAAVAADPPAPDAPAADAPAAVVEAAPVAPPPEPEAPAAAPDPPPPPVDVAARLATLDAAASARGAVEALLAAWHVAPLGPGEPATLADLPGIAQRRGLEYLPLVGNASMLRLLDLPSILELRIPGTDRARYALLTGMSERGPKLAIDGEATAVDAGFLDRHWFGSAYLVSRDFEALGPAFGNEVRGERVARLQTLLRRAGTYAGGETGRFDPATTAAVLDFQRSRFLVADGRVGRFTRIVLYAAVGGYPRPTLGSSS